MALRSDVIQGLIAFGAIEQRAPVLDTTGRCSIVVPIPAEVSTKIGGQLTVEVEVDDANEWFTLRSILAGIGAAPRAPFLYELLNRLFFPNQTDGMGFAINVEANALLLVHTWVVPSITPGQFTELVRRFILGTLRQLDKVADLATSEPTLRPIPKERPRR